MAEDKVDRSDMWKAVKWIVIAFIACLITFGIWKAWSIATAPARVVGDAAGSVKTGVSNVVNRLDVEIPNARRFNTVSENAFKVLNEMETSDPDGMKDRAFRIANLNGADNKVCEISYDFGQGDVPVYVAADNKEHEAAKAVGQKTDRRIRIVIVTSEETLGLNSEYDAEAEVWNLSWRPSSINKPYDDSWTQGPVMSVLRDVPKICG
ncbi:hypothetical protein [Litorimonas sp. WD9-15]|uniref:hypothetical protein n=1 Tax=Litorimonas sp. WD9-15 TaxID=3418716 RepID=UPI003CFDF4E9